MTNDARQTAQNWADRLTEGKAEDALGLLAPDVRYEIIGKTPISGVYKGFDDFRRRLVSVMATFPVPPVVRCNTVIADGELAVVLGSGRGEGPYGPYVQDHYAWVMRVKDGRIVEMTEFIDTVALELAAFGRRLLGPGKE